MDDNVKLKPKSKARERWVAREVLGSMFLDMEYLKKFLRRPDIKADHGSAPFLRQNAHEALNYLKIREAFWKQQNPMYSRKYGLNFNNNVSLTPHYGITTERRFTPNSFFPGGIALRATRARPTRSIASNQNGRRVRSCSQKHLSD